MEPDVIRMYSSSPPPMEDGAEEEEDEFGDFGGFSGVPTSTSFNEFDTPATFNQTPALAATSPPELLNNGGVVRFSNLSSGPRANSKSNGVVPGGCQYDSPLERTVNVEELKKLADHTRANNHSTSLDKSVRGQTDNIDKPVDCNGGVPEVLTNGFVTFEIEGIPSLQNSNRSKKKGTTTDENLDNSNRDERLAEDTCQQQRQQKHSNVEQGIRSGDVVRDTPITTGSNDIASSDSLSHLAEVRDTDEGLSNGDGGFQRDTANSEQRNIEPDFAHKHSATEMIAGVSENRGSPDTDDEDGNGEQADEKSASGNETETETETSFGRPLSTDALEEYGDISTTGSVPSPLLQEETATPADHSQLLEDDDDGEDFGDFGDAGSFSGQGFADFDQPELQLEEQPAPPTQELVDHDKDFGEFDAPNSHIGGGKAIENEDRGKFADFPSSNSFADFSSAPVGADPDPDAGWNAFDEPVQGQGEGNSWAAFGEEPTANAPLETGEDEWQEMSYSTMLVAIMCLLYQVALCSRLEKLFLEIFPDAPAPQVRVEVVSLKTLLEPPVRLQQEEHEMMSGGDVLWRQLLDIHEAFGLRHQWGGSHSNKTLLCSLGIDIRNILFTGQKKQPVIVPMYAASLGMLEPTKEPVKPISAAEMITSIAQQVPPVAPAEIISTSPPDTAQEVLPPVQFDWSSSGLTNPLDASGGSSLLNLDFFGPVEDSGPSSSTSIPGVDPELYELTTAKLDPSGSGTRVADAFARLMSTMEKTSTSTRKPRKEENLSEETLKVIAGLPDLSFMQAKVLMFPTTLTPLGCSSDPDPTLD
ncbi:unnamed protein product [Oncorhynchus mykiss]|uniref:Aftiphilin clathrin-binding box domain-containing protein n=1 Tax=Oncorhynchus mykiss TaxID=8022 RepID=A0A060W0A5_ONCMY|nr:unnamed protein product [Oncorhynchus mykiss]